MQYAISMRFGSMPVDAQECDYTSFITQGLLCPHCTRTVYLVRGCDRPKHERKLKSGESIPVKESVIPAHFAHHSTDKKLIETCELRSSKLTATQRQALVVVARGQIALKFRRKFFAMVKTSPKLYDTETVPLVLLSLWQKASLKQPIAAKAQLATLVDLIVTNFAHPAQIKKVKTQIPEAIDRWVDQFQEDREGIPHMYREMLDGWMNVLDKQMQNLIVCEALHYLVQKPQVKELRRMIECALYAWALAEAARDHYGDMTKSVTLAQRERIYEQVVFDRNSFDADFLKAMARAVRKMIGVNKEEFENLFFFVRDDIIQMLSFVDWPKEFEDREVN